ncbi:MAG TPA: bifunctional phosphoglucose/phosphomannose isomerase, partial [Candidatus Omnitrophica bacterium]|nr:bifunctional phosphoglucose/phosphomannose isomerase [Candidatus Omnitrophota bacterium]
MNILDELSTIEGIDKSNMRQLLYDLPHQGERETELMRDVRLPGEYKEVRNITITGLGGSSVGGDILKNLLRDRLRIPLIVNRSYTLPRLINKESLLICVSFSGNTEETLSA